MNMLGRILGGLGLVTLSAVYGLACVAPVDSEPEDITEDSSEDLSGEENVGEAAEAIGTCHGVVTCPDPKSCGSWSTYHPCGTLCVSSLVCSGCGPIGQDPDCVPEDIKGLRRFSESFRTCTLQNGSTCTEYRAIAQIVECGCTP